MKKIELKSSYHFYDMSELKRNALVGKWFVEIGRDTIYFPVLLAHGEFNYGFRQGLIFITPIMKHQGNKWFRVGASSPDDLDADLDFNEKECKIRSDVIAYLKTMNKINVTYRGILGQIQEHFKAGEITS